MRDMGMGRAILVFLPPAKRHDESFANISLYVCLRVYSNIIFESLDVRTMYLHFAFSI